MVEEKRQLCGGAWGLPLGDFSGGHCLAGEKNEMREVRIGAEEICFLEAASERVIER